MEMFSETEIENSNLSDVLILAKSLPHLKTEYFTKFPPVLYAYRPKIYKQKSGAKPLKSRLYTTYSLCATFYA
jgi:hypothetical protein